MAADMSGSHTQDEDLDRYPVAASDDELGDVPVIDLANLGDGCSADVEPGAETGAEPGARAVADSVGAAARDWGFFQVVNHGVDSDLIDATWDVTRAYFAQATETKKCQMRTRENPWGYYNNELTKNQRDRKEVFDFTTSGRDPIFGSENRWPADPPAFRSVLSAYRDEVTTLGRRLLRAFSAGLGHPPGHFDTLFGPSHTGFVRLNYYPVHDPLADSATEHASSADLGVHHHTDAGALTVLMQDRVGGLQVFRAGRWHNVRPIPGAFVINTGDMMQVWSNDHYQAAVHRVLAMESTDRFSIPFFFNPVARAVVEPLAATVTEERPPRYRPIPWSDFRYQRTDGDYADYGPEVQISHYRTERPV